MCLTACNSNKNSSVSDSKDRKSDPAETITEAISDEDESASEETEAAAADMDTEAFMRESNYLLDTIDSGEINKFIDALYAGEPKAEEDISVIIKRVTDTLDFKGNGVSLYSNGGLISLELCNTSEMKNDGAWVNGRDNVCKINWNGYEFNDDFSPLKKENPRIVANAESYTNTQTPGSIMVEFHIFDEARATEVYEILVERMNKDHPDITCEEGKIGPWKTYEAAVPNEGGKDTVYASIYMKYDDDQIGCYLIQYTVRFGPLETAGT